MTKRPVLVRFISDDGILDLGKKAGVVSGLRMGSGTMWTLDNPIIIKVGEQLVIKVKAASRKKSDTHIVYEVTL